MAIIPQRSLFSWEEVDALGDLERLVLVIQTLPDAELMRTLEAERGRGRNDYPVRAVWNSVLAGVVFGHESAESLRRELRRNAPLRDVCGFDVLAGVDAVPPAYVYTRFLHKLMRHAGLIDRMFEDLAGQLREVLPEFGKVLAIDGKALPTHARPPAKDAPAKTPDGRRDTDADFGAKAKKGTRPDGTVWEKTVRWFGYKLHLIADATYDLPVAWSLTGASAADITAGEDLIASLAEHRPGVLNHCDVLLADKGYDSTAMHTTLWDEHGIKAVIPIRDLWQDGEPTRRADGTRNVVYDAHGTVYCVCMKTGVQRPMAFGGFEADRGTLKYKCPAVCYKSDCPGRSTCPVHTCVRIKLDQDRRIFTPIARSSYTWGRLYKERTSVERVFSRVDVSYGFERHFIRGRRKMALRCGLALVVMLATALGRVRQGKPELARSLVQAAA